MNWPEVIICGVIPFLLFLFFFFSQTGYWTRIIEAQARKQKDPKEYIERMRARLVINAVQYRRLMEKFSFSKLDLSPLPPVLDEQVVKDIRTQAAGIVILPYTKRFQSVIDLLTHIKELERQLEVHHEK